MPLSFAALQVLALVAAPGSFAEILATPVPHTCRWTFPGGSPATSASCSPPPVRYSTPGAKSVTLPVCSTAPHGPCTTLTKTLTVLDARPVVVALIVSPLQPYAGDTLHLTATATGKPPLSWLWSLPGGGTATTNTATVATARLAPGLITVKLRVANSFGSTTRTLSVRLLDPKPVLSGLTLSTPTPAVGTVLHAAPLVTGRPPLTFLWSLDGRPISTAATLDWEVAGTPGPHILTLRVTNAKGTASLSRTLTVEQQQVLDFRPVCPNLLCLFAVNTPVVFNLVLSPSTHPVRYEYDWIGNGPSTESADAPVSLHVYTVPGNYRPRVRVTSTDGTEVHVSSQFLLVTL